jgi:hypothetical protein
MDSDYMFLCGVMWCRFGQQDAGKELLRAATSSDPEIRALAGAMWAKGALRLRNLERRKETHRFEKLPGPDHFRREFPTVDIVCIRPMGSVSARVPPKPPERLTSR